MTEQNMIAFRPTFEQWLAGADLDALIDGAIAAAKAKRDEDGIVTASDDHLGTYVRLPLDNDRSKPLVQRLATRGLGDVNIEDAFAWVITYRDLIGFDPEPTFAQRHAVMETFAHALCEPGFIFEFHRI